MFVYVLLSHYSNGVECWDDLVAVYADETAAELAAIEWNETKGWISDDGMEEKSYNVKKEKVL